MTEKEVTFTDKTTFQCTGAEVKEGHLEALKEEGVLKISFVDDDELRVGEVDIDIDQLAEFSFRYELLDMKAGHAQVSALKYFHENPGQHTTNQVTEGTEYSKGSISRALNRLEEEGFLERKQNGVYALDE